MSLWGSFTPSLNSAANSPSQLFLSPAIIPLLTVTSCLNSQTWTGSVPHRLSLGPSQPGPHVIEADTRLCLWVHILSESRQGYICYKNHFNEAKQRFWPEDSRRTIYSNSQMIGLFPVIDAPSRFQPEPPPLRN